tara:strand:- start:95 stop:853 length:759 start_codon:yes stop_codon:yes gene_type:complete
MHKVRIIPRLDIKGSNLIKSIQFEGLRVIGDPNDFAKKYYEDGADELLYMDVVASLYGRNSLMDLISKAVKNVFIPITVGGGIRTIEDAGEVLRSGADKIAINTAAIKNPKLITQLVNKFGSQSIVVSIEAKKIGNDWEAYIENGREKTGLDVIYWAKKSADLGAGEILLTSVDREGTRKGYDLELIKGVQNKIKIPLIVSGGMSDPKDAVKAVVNGHASGVSMADILHYKRFNLKQIKKVAIENNLNVRPF